jgi:hypothetical protein
MAYIPVRCGNETQPSGNDIALNEAKVESYHEIERSTWNSRGWTFQDRLLSRRIVYFRRRSISYECRYKGYHSEAGWRRDVPSWFSFSKTRLLQSVALEDPTISIEIIAPLHLYQNVKDFSRRFFTYRKDKLIAIEGLARRISKGLLNRDLKDTYVSGLGKEHIEYGLLWSISDENSSLAARTANITPRNQDMPLIPSWSWASVEKPVHWLFFFRTTWSKYSGACFRVNWNETKLSLAVCGHVFNVSVSEMQTDSTLYHDDHFIKFGPRPHGNLIYDTLQDAKHIGYCLLDGERDNSVQSCFALPIFWGRNGTPDNLSLLRIAGLLLHQTEENPGEFRRIGLFWSGSVSLQSEVSEILIAVRNALQDDSLTRPLLYLK